MVEQSPYKRLVPGSSPGGPTIGARVGRDRNMIEKLYDRQTAILDWLRSLGHEVEYGTRGPECDDAGLDRFIRKTKPK